MCQSCGLDQAIRFLPQEIKSDLLALPKMEKERIREVRFRMGQPVAVTLDEGMAYVGEGKLLPFTNGSVLPPLSRKDLERIFYACCGDSVYSCEAQLRQGFFTLPGGHRAGVCGTVVQQEGKIVNLTRITSLSLRIARAVNGAASDLLPLYQTDFPNLLLAGAPGSGKTTLLRDLARSLNDTHAGREKKLVVIDERGEIAGVHQGIPSFDLGPNCDVMDGCSKREGILIALRALSPHVILCDELGGKEDVEAIREGANAGVRFIATIHAGSREELVRRPQMQSLLESRIFSWAALLCPGAPKGKVQEWIRL